MSFTEHDTGYTPLPHRNAMQAGPGGSPTPHQLPTKKGDDTAVPKAPARGKPRAQFLVDIPAHEYKLRCDRPINATLVDLIVILPQWFRNPGVAWRMLNNGITAAVHFAILDKHRHLGLTSSEEAERARKRMEELRDTHSKLTEERGEKGRDMERRRVRIEQTEKKMAELKDNIENEVHAAHDEYLKMESHIKLYVTEMEQSI